LRRVLLSSLDGAAITSVKIKGVSHEFSTIDGVLEDVVQILLYLKRVRFRMEIEGPVTVTIKKTGNGPVTAGDITTPAGVEVVNTDQKIATITDKGTNLEMEITVERGIGHVPIEQQQREKEQIGTIAVDAIYTPIKRVNFLVENMRVGKRTDFDKVTLDITTDGSVSAKEAFTKAVEILVGQFSSLQGELGELIHEEKAAQVQEVDVVTEKKEDVAVETAEEKALATPVQELNDLSTRTLNVLEAHSFSTVQDIVKLTEAELDNVEGMGEKSVKEIKKAVGMLGLTLKQEEN
jgi:DNA-directed RNA polymerase subunit alpha